MSASVLQTSNLSLSAGEKTLCQQLDWEIGDGEIWAVLGRNGAGKTTLLHSLAALHPADLGHVALLNQPLAQWSGRDRARQLGLLMQEQDHAFSSSVLEYVLMGRHPYLRPWQWENEQDYQLAHQALQLLDMDDFAKRNTQSLSGGEFQRMRIAMLLVQDPKLMLLDEPVNHLDLSYQHAVLRLLRTLSRQSDKSIVLSLHDVNLAMQYCTHALLLFDNGRTLHGKTQDVLTETSLSELYDYPIRQLVAGKKRLFVANESGDDHAPD